MAEFHGQPLLTASPEIPGWWERASIRHPDAGRFPRLRRMMDA